MRASKQDASDDLSKESSSPNLVPEGILSLGSSDEEVIHRLPHLPTPQPLSQQQTI